MSSPRCRKVKWRTMKKLWKAAIRWRSQIIIGFFIKLLLDLAILLNALSLERGSLRVTHISSFQIFQSLSSWGTATPTNRQRVSTNWGIFLNFVIIPFISHTCCHFHLSSSGSWYFSFWKFQIPCSSYMMLRFHVSFESFPPSPKWLTTPVQRHAWRKWREKLIIKKSSESTFPVSVSPHPTILWYLLCHYPPQCHGFLYPLLQ